MWRGGYGKRLAKALSAYNIKIHAIIDSNPNLWGTRIFEIPCISIYDIQKDYDIFISVSDAIIANEIKNNIITAGKSNKLVTYADFYKDMEQERII